jgi:hypothetical protein
VIDPEFDEENYGSFSATAIVRELKSLYVITDPHYFITGLMDMILQCKIFLLSTISYHENGM